MEKIPIWTDGETKNRWRLKRERDGLIKESNDIIWVDWKEDRTMNDMYNEIAIGRSLLMSPFNEFFTWLTTTVTEIEEQTQHYIKFKTENSTYELFNIE